jgi:hypothetical protein
MACKDVPDFEVPTAPESGVMPCCAQCDWFKGRENSVNLMGKDPNLASYAPRGLCRWIWYKGDAPLGVVATDWCPGFTDRLTKKKECTKNCYSCAYFRPKNEKDEKGQVSVDFNKGLCVVSSFDMFGLPPEERVSSDTCSDWRPILDHSPRPLQKKMLDPAKSSFGKPDADLAERIRAKSQSNIAFMRTFEEEDENVDSLTGIQLEDTSMTSAQNNETADDWGDRG